MGAFIKHRGLAPVAIVAALLLGGCATTAQPAEAPKLAITIDDIPVHGPFPEGRSALDVNRQMIAAIREAQVPGVTGFVNAVATVRSPETEQALKDWQDAGIPLGNHTWSHKNLNDISVAEYAQEIVRNEPFLEKYSAGRDWHWFRYPFLSEGDDPAKRAAIRAVLAKRGYRIAGVSMGFSDWQYTAPYARCKTANDRTSIRRMEEMYLASLRENIGFSRSLGRAIYHREIPQVLLMHVGAFSAHMMPRVIAEYRRAGFQFVSLAEAESDPAYAADVDPRLPSRSPDLARRAQALGIAVPKTTDYGAKLNDLCQGALTAPGR